MSETDPVIEQPIDSEAGEQSDVDSTRPGGTTETIAVTFGAEDEEAGVSSEQTWLWPSSEEINDFPDPLGFDAEWKQWEGTMADGPSPLAEIFCREYVQNSWDSIQERLSRLSEAGESEPTDHGVSFSFVRLHGPAALQFAQRFGLHGHAERLAGMNDKHRRDNRLDDSHVAAGDFDGISLLVASERYGEGMAGPWNTGGKAGVVSRLKPAVIQTASSKDSEASGGSWGHGKKAIANASTCRTLAVYTCSSAYEGDVDEVGLPVTRRFLGVSYWRRHDLGDRAHVGLGLGGRLGADGTYGGFRPLENEEADDLVRSLGVPGFAVRDPDTPGQTGVSYLLVEPSFTPEDLAAAIVRNWWPLLAVHPDGIRLHGYDGAPMELTPSAVPALRPFLHAFDLAGGRAAPREVGDRLDVLRASGTEPVGTLALTSDATEGGWSYDMPDDNVSLVALVRNDMVIAYQKSPPKQRSKAPFVRGVLVVDRYRNRWASEHLKMAEPHLHNEWVTVKSPSVPGYAAELAHWTLDRVHKAVSALRSAIKQKVVQEQRHFPAFSALFAAGSSPTSRRAEPPQPKPHRSFSITFEPKLLDANIHDPSRIRMMCIVQVSLLPRVAKRASSIEAELDLGWKVLEERGPVRDDRLADGSSVVVPTGFTLVGGKLRGPITAEPVSFEWHSRFFPDDWQVVPDPFVKELAETAAEAGA